MANVVCPCYYESMKITTKELLLSISDYLKLGDLVYQDARGAM